MRKGRGKHFSQRAVSHVISVTIMTGLVIAMGIATLAWAQGVSLNFIQGYSSAINADIARLKERVTTEYIHYDPIPNNVTIYLLNCGMIDDVATQSITIRSSNGTLVERFENPTLKFFNGSVVDGLDQRQEGYVEVSLGTTSLTSGEYYFLTIVTTRGAIFNARFVA